jgi:arachidonate 15-lipoxygenase
MIMNDDVTLFTTASDDTRTARNQELASARELYQWYQNYLYPIPTLFNKTLGDVAGSSTVRAVADTDGTTPPDLSRAMLSPEQHAVITGHQATMPDAGGDRLMAALQGHELFAGAEARIVKFFGSDHDKQTGIPDPDVPSLLNYRVPRVLFVTASSKVRTNLIKANGPLRTPEDYHAQYEAFLKDSESILLTGKKVIGFDQVHEVFNSDVIFGWQRLAGTNPRAIKALTSARADELLKKMPLTDSHIQAVAGPGATLQGEIAQNRLYFCDFWLLDGLQLQEGRYMPPAIGVFWSDARSPQLLPVAIQLSQTPGSIRTPGDADWELTKLLFQVADFNYHEMGPHLCEGHFGQEAFIVATRRNLSDKHPVGALLSQIYWALLYNNALGRLQLVNKGGFADKMMAGDLENGSLRIVRDYYAKVWSWNDWNIESYLEAQGTTDTKALPVYPYRDDGLPLWGAIKAFAEAYVSSYYAQSTDVAGDSELRDWVDELVHPDKGNLATKGFPTTLTTKADLAEVLARLIWQASAGHGGINYSQFQYFAVVPSSPGAAYATTGTFMGALPPLEQTAYQGDILNVLTQKVFGSLGTYDSSFSSGLNTLARNAVKDFQSALQACATAVDARNASYPRAFLTYPFLNPNNLPNSTNI